MYIYPSITFDYLQFGLFLYAFGYEHDKDVVLVASARNAKPQSSALSIVGYIYIFFLFSMGWLRDKFSHTKGFYNRLFFHITWLSNVLIINLS